MSATNKTTNYELPLFVGTDRPSWLVDFNGAMTAIDTAIYAAKTQSDTAKNTADNANAASTSAVETANAATETANAATQSAQNAVAIANNANTQAGDAKTDAHAALEKAEIAENKLSVSLLANEQSAGNAMASAIFYSDFITLFKISLNAQLQNLVKHTFTSPGTTSFLEICKMTGNPFNLNTSPDFSTKGPMISLGTSIATKNNEPTYLSLLLGYNGTYTVVGFEYTTSNINTDYMLLNNTFTYLPAGVFNVDIG